MNKRLPIKIGLDFHGVVDDRPAYFAEFSAAAVRCGYEIHIITGGPYGVVKEMLDKWGIRYSKIFAIIDYYDTLGEVKYFANGEFKIPDKLWDSAKAEYCQLNGINIHIDDSSKYVKWFTTPYCHYSEAEKICETDNRAKIDFSHSPQEVLRQIEKIVSSVQYY